MIYINSESQRIPTLIEYIKKSIEELERDINECDYEEDPAGNLIYSPNCYAYEKGVYQSEKRKLEIILELLTREVPFNIKDW